MKRLGGLWKMPNTFAVVINDDNLNKVRIQ